MIDAERLTGAWEATDTTVHEVERQLHRIMRELSGPATPADARHGHLVPRAIVLNILIHADEDGEAERAAETMAALALRHPSRTLLLLAEPDAPSDGLDASITTQCALWPSVGGHLCFEQVRLCARGSTALHLTSVAEPLLVADLPVILWWLGRPPAGSEQLLDLCDRLVVDSAMFPDAPAGLAALDAYTETSGRRLQLGDLGWRRQAIWRQVLADLFDPPDARPYLSQIRQVTVDYAATRGGVVSAAPLLLVGWLDARLGWNPVATTTSGGALAATFALDDEGGGISVRLRARAVAEVDPGEPLQVTLQAGDGEPPATFAVRRAAARGVLETRVALPGGREQQRHAALALPTRPELLARELELPAADPLYAESLAAAARLVR